MALNAPLPALISEGFGFPNGTIQITESYLTYTGLLSDAEFETALAANPNLKRQANISLVLVGHQLDENGQIVGDPDKPIRQYLRATARTDGWFDRNGDGGTESCYRLVNYKLDKDGDIDMASVEYLDPNQEVDDQTGKLGEQPHGCGIDFPGSVRELGRNTAAGKYIQSLAKLGLEKDKIVPGLPITGIVPITIECHQEKKTSPKGNDGTSFEFTEFTVTKIAAFPYDEGQAQAPQAQKPKSTAGGKQSQPAQTQAQVAKTESAKPTGKAKASEKKAAPANDEKNELVSSALDALLSLEIANGPLVQMMVTARAKKAGFDDVLSEAGLSYDDLAAYLKSNGKHEADGASVEIVNGKWVFAKA